MPRRRSPREIAFRLRQESVNLFHWFRPPRPPAAGPLPPRLPRLPDPRPVAEALRGTDFAEQILALAEQILAHRFPIFDGALATGPDIRWRRDYSSGRETEPGYFRLIPYLDAARSGDHKNIWELNRHQHLVVLAQAGLWKNDPRYQDEIGRQLESWWQQNPYTRGINWTSALEVAFRTLSWLWVCHFAGERLQPALRRRLIESLYQHGRYLANNLSVYFSPNTHLLGEAVALHALGVLLPDFPEAAHWARTGARIAAEEIDRQVQPDGSHFEQSTYYHVYALDMLLFHARLAGPGAACLETLARMAQYLQAVMGPSRSLPFLGDDDGGRFFHPYGRREHFGRATLATCARMLGRDEFRYRLEDLYPQAAWWLGESHLQPPPAGAVTFRSRLFPDSGLAVLAAGSSQAIVDGGRWGPWGAGHSHSDTLSIIVRLGEEDILIDPGTYTYVGSAKWRDWFRGSAAHNTLSVDGMDQALPAGPFSWRDKPGVRVRRFQTDDVEDSLDAECAFRGFLHRRVIRFRKDAGALLVFDQLTGPPGEHEVEQIWHPGETVEPSSPGVFRIGLRAVLVTAPDAVFDNNGWRSPIFSQKIAAPVIRIRRRTTLPYGVAAAMSLGNTPAPTITTSAGGAEFWYLGKEIRLS